MSLKGWSWPSLQFANPGQANPVFKQSPWHTFGRQRVKCRRLMTDVSEEDTLETDGIGKRNNDGFPLRCVDEFSIRDFQEDDIYRPSEDIFES